MHSGPDGHHCSPLPSLRCPRCSPPTSASTPQPPPSPLTLRCCPHRWGEPNPNVGKNGRHRLSRQLNDMVSINQSAFIKGRSIQDISCSCSRWQGSSSKIKLDSFSNLIFQRPSSDFLFALNRGPWKLGFGSVWCDMICLVLVSFAGPSSP